MNESLFTVTQVAKVFGVSKQSIHNWIDAGRFPNTQEVGEGGGKIVLITESDVEMVKREEADKLLAKLHRLGFQAIAA